MQKRQKTILILSLGLVLIGVVISGVVLSRSSPHHNLVTREQYELISVGMSQAEVDHVLRGPPRNCFNESVTVWVPQEDSNLVSARYPRGTPTIDFFANVETQDGGWESVWVCETGLIAVDFGTDGRVQNKYFSTVHIIGGPSISDWITSRPKQMRRAVGL